MPLILYLDLTNERLIASSATGQPCTLAPFFLGDLVSLQLQLLTPDHTGTADSPYVNVTDTLSVEIAIVNPAPGAPVIYTSASLTQAAGPPVNWSGLLNFDTDILVAAMASVATLNAFVEIHVANAVDGSSSTRLQTSVTVKTVGIGGASPLGRHGTAVQNVMYDTLAALAADPTPLSPGIALVWDSGAGLPARYAWRAANTDTPDGVTTILPAGQDIGTAGRWKLTI